MKDNGFIYLNYGILYFFIILVILLILDKFFFHKFAIFDEIIVKVSTQLVYPFALQYKFCDFCSGSPPYLKSEFRKCVILK